MPWPAAVSGAQTCVKPSLGKPMRQAPRLFHSLTGVLLQVPQNDKHQQRHILEITDLHIQTISGPPRFGQKRGLEKA